MKTSDFNYDLPERLIAQTPAEPRDSSRMMVCNRNNGLRRDRIFRDITEYLRPGDVMVINETRVIPARLLGAKESTGVPTEFLLLRRRDIDTWEALVKPGRRLHAGDTVSFGDGLLRAEILDTTDAGGRVVRFLYDGVFENLLEKLGEMPLPPYIHEKLRDPNRYQTVYAKLDGSAAAPTAGLHFTQELLEKVRKMGVEIVPVLLHVGLGTFRPVKEEDVEKHVMHSEYYEVSSEAARKINRAKEAGGRLLCIGTTSMRTIETVADENGVIHAGSGMTNNDQHLYKARRILQGDGRAADQLPPAAKHAADACFHADGQGKRPGRLPGSGGKGISLLLVRRLHAAWKRSGKII